MRPLDPRLLRHVRAARGYVVLSAALGVATAALVVVQALLLATVVAGVAMDGQTPSQVRAALVWLCVVVAGRAGVAWAQDRFGHRAATAVVGQLRALVCAHVVRLGPAALDGDRGPALATLTTRGLDSLDGYLTRYLPQLVLSATVTPAVLAVVFWQDLVAGLTIAVTLPLVPVFMVLVGLATRTQADRRLRTMQRLGAQVLDLVAGLPTLRALGREQRQARRVREVGEAYRRATMGTLRTAFLSALVLETLTTICVALVAVGVGFRLLYGDLDLRTGLAVLILAPEVYLPLRMLGLHYHASVDGLAAAQEALAVLDLTPPVPGTLRAPVLGVADGSSPEERAHPDGWVVARLDGVGVVHPGRERATPSGLDACVRLGRVLALAGPNGTGKSTAVQALLGLRTPDTGRVLLGPAAPADATVDLADVDPATWWAQLSWVPQQVQVVPGSLADNVRLAVPDAPDDALAAAAAAAGLAAVVAELPDGWQTRVGHGGVGLSAGQRQRLGLARALLHPAPVVVLDEPTAHLDTATEQVVHATVRRLRAEGRAVVLVAHRPSLLALADEVVRVHEGPVPRDPAAPAPESVPA